MISGRYSVSQTALAITTVITLTCLPPLSAAAQEIKRTVEMSYVCSRDESGKITLAKVGQRQAFAITSWAEPIQQEYSYNDRRVVLELYNFRFRCGAAGEIHVSDLYLASPSAQRWKAHRAF